MAYKFQLGTYTASGSLKQEGGITVSDSGAGNDAKITIGSAELTEAELELLDGITAGTGAADKALVLDSSRDVDTINALGIASMANNWTNAGRTVADAGILTTVDINGGTVDGTTIGATTHTTGKFTTVDATTDFTIDGLVLTADTITNDAVLEIVSTGLTLNASLDIALSADGGNVTMDDGTTTAFDFNVDDVELKIHDDAQVANYCSIAVGDNGATTITTVDADAAAANLIITADGTVDIDSAGALTLDSGAGILLEPAAGSNVLIDGNVAIDAGVVTGITALTATAIDGVIGGDTARAGSFAAVIGTTGVYSGILKTDDTTAATSTTDGSLQTDGGLSVALDAVIGDDLILLSDKAAIHFGADKDITLTHAADAGLILQSVEGGAGAYPSFDMRMSSSSPADNDLAGLLKFSGYNDVAELTNYAGIQAKVMDVTNATEDGALFFETIINGSPVELLDIGGTAASTITVKDGAYDFNIASHDGSNGLKLAGTLVTAAAADVNILLGCAGNGLVVADLTKLAGVNATAAELNYLDLTTLGTSEASKVVSADASGDITIAGAAANMVWDKSEDALEFADNASIEIGTGLDMKMYHDGTNSYITNAEGALKIATETSGIAVTIGHGTSEVTVADNLTVTGDLTVSGTTFTLDSTTIHITSSFTFEGATPNAHETVFGVVNPTADATINLPALSAGTYYLPCLADTSTDASSAVTAAEFALLDGASSVGTTALAQTDGFMHNDAGTMKQTQISKIADFFASDGLTAASGKLEVSLDGLGSSKTTVHQADSFALVDSEGSDITKKITFSNFEDEIFGNITGDATIAAGGALTIAAGAVEHGMLAEDIISGQAALGGTGVAQGDEFLFSDAGTVKKITASNLEDWIFGNVSGDATVAAGGALTIAAGAVEHGMLADDIISGQAELAAGGVATADELMISDGGTIKRIGVDSFKAYVNSQDVQLVDDSGTLAVGMNYWADLGGAESATLPASPTVGDIVYVKAASNCSSTNTVTINKAGSQTIDGQAAILLESPFAAVSLCYVVADVWRIF